MHPASCKHSIVAWPRQISWDMSNSFIIFLQCNCISIMLIANLSLADKNFLSWYTWCPVAKLRKVNSRGRLSIVLAILNWTCTERYGLLGLFGSLQSIHLQKFRNLALHFHCNVLNRRQTAIGTIQKLRHSASGKGVQSTWWQRNEEEVAGRWWRHHHKK